MKSQGSATRGIWPTSTKPIGSGASGGVQRAKVLQATVDLVSKRGYSGISAERICKEAGVSFPTFRKHFRDKEECFLAAFDEAVGMASERIVQAVDRAEDGWARRMAVGLSTLLEVVEDDPPRARLCLVEALTAGPAGIDRYEAAVRLCLPALRGGRDESRRGVDLPPLLEETIAGGLAWSIHQKIALGEAEAVSKLAGPLLETMLTPYLGEARVRAMLSEGTHEL